MKRILTVALCVMLLLALPVVSSAERRVALLFADLSDSFTGAIRAELMPRQAEQGVTFMQMDAHLSQFTQVDQAEQALGQGAEVLCIQLCEYGASSAVKSILKLAEEQGVPCIFFARAIAYDEASIQAILDEYSLCAYVNHRTEDIGTIQGMGAGEQLNEDYSSYDRNGDGKIAYLGFQGDAWDPDCLARAANSLSACNALLPSQGHPELVPLLGSEEDSVIYDQMCMWSANFSKDELSRIIPGQMPEIIFCGNDDMALGCINALWDIGYNTGKDGDPVIPIYGVDGTDLAFELIENGRLAGTVTRSAKGIADGLLEMIGRIEVVDADAASRYITVPYDFTGR